MLKSILQRLTKWLEPSTVPTLGRNEPCHCGSGRKYKRCCLQKDADRQRSAREAGALATGTGGGGRPTGASRALAGTTEYKPPKGRGPA